MRDLGLAFRLITPINEGWDSDVFDIDGRWIFRFPRRPSVVAALERECRVLPKLVAAMPFDVPDPRFVGELEGQQFMGYRRLPGQAYLRGDNVVSVAEGIKAMHAFPVDRAAVLLGDLPTMDAWVQSYVELRDYAEKEVAPLVDGETAAAMVGAFEEFLATDWSVVTPTFVHRDLGAEHILIDRDTRELSGIIDFGDMAIGDPTIDFVGLRISAGIRLTDTAINAYGGEIDEGRMRFYVQVGAVHAVAYGLLIEDEELVADAVASLARRLRGDDGRRA